MFSRIRKRITFANVAMTLALVFAMGGGAYAAGKYVITSTKQISPKVLTALKGKKGANGVNGTQGPAGEKGAAGTNGTPGTNGKDGVGAQGPGGVTGPVGPKGATGANGVNGTNGATGATGANGTNGTNGATGATGAIGPQGPLQSGKSETGTWAYIGSKENGAVGADAISFTLPLESAPEAEFVYPGKPGTNCTGTAAAPTAPNGFLCVYAVLPEEFEGKPLTRFLAFNKGEQFNGPHGASKEGALATFETRGIGEAPLPFADAEGTWMVTAP
jgi:Collagen triple helix repeat (20 copies)